MRGRSMADAGPWCWQEKEARRSIRKALNGAPMTAYALGVYDALTENASDKMSDRFETFHPHLATLAGCSVAQLKRALKLLVEFGLVRIDTPKLRGACTFTLLALSDTTMAPIEPALALSEKRGSRATTEESVEEHSEEQLKLVNTPAAVSPAARNVCDSEWLKTLSNDPTYAGLNIDIEFGKMRNWCEVRKKLVSRRRFVSWLHRADRPMTTAPASVPVAEKKPWQIAAEALFASMVDGSWTEKSVLACRAVILGGGLDAKNWMQSVKGFGVYYPDAMGQILRTWNLNHKWEPMS